MILILEFLVGGAVLLSLIQTVVLCKLYADLRRLLEVNQKLASPPPVEVDLDAGRVDDVIERCLEDIADHPNRAKLHWYLGKAYYKKQLWREAKEQMEIVAELEPSWRSDYTDSYLQVLDRRLNDA